MSGREGRQIGIQRNSSLKFGSRANRQLLTPYFLGKDRLFFSSNVEVFSIKKSIKVHFDPHSPPKKSRTQVSVGAMGKANPCIRKSNNSQFWRYHIRPSEDNRNCSTELRIVFNAINSGRNCPLHKQFAIPWSNSVYLHFAEYGISRRVKGRNLNEILCGNVSVAIGAERVNPQLRFLTSRKRNCGFYK